MVDDSALVLGTFARALRRYADVTTAEGFEAGRDALAAGLVAYVVAIDLDMPPHDGRQLWDWISIHRPALVGRRLLLAGPSAVPALETWRRTLPALYRIEKSAPVADIAAALAALTRGI
jgi:DNA-binding NarL/FixJ family response regulator